MKKFIAVILAFLYLSTSIGATLHIHYCMGKLADWGLDHKESNTCDKCGMEKSSKNDNGCCKDEHKFVKNNSDQKIVETSFQLLEVLGTVYLPGYADLPSVKLASVTEEYPLSNAPPRSSSIAVYLLNRNFLI